MNDEIDGPTKHWPGIFFLVLVWITWGVERANIFLKSLCKINQLYAETAVVHSSWDHNLILISGSLAFF